MKRIIIVVSVLLLGATCIGAEELGAHGAPPPQDPRLEFLKQLAGTWSAGGGTSTG